MTNYRFETYQPEFLDQQIELVLDVTADWTYFNYPNNKQLQQTYSAENFTPTTRYYAFDDDDRLVGFLSSAFAGDKSSNLQFPFVREGHEELRATLMEKAVSTFEEAGVCEITANLQSTWQGAADILTSFGFTRQKIQTTQIFASTDQFDYDISTDTTDYVEVDPKKDREELIRVFSTEMTHTREEIGKIIDTWNDATHIIMNTITKEDGKIITHSMVVKNNNDPTLAQMTHISIYDKAYSHRRHLQMRYMFQELKRKGYKTIQLFAIPPEELETYEIGQFSIRKTIQYLKPLTPLQSA